MKYNLKSPTKNFLRDDGFLRDVVASHLSPPVPSFVIYERKRHISAEEMCENTEYTHSSEL